MNTSKQHFGFSPKILVLAVLAAFGPAHAEEGADDVAQLIRPESSVSVGIGGSTGDSRNDRSIFGEFNGLRDHDYNLLLDIDYATRNDETGQWVTLKARNLGLDNREVGVALQKQGDWRISAEYNEITRHDPRFVNTADTGVGTSHPVINVLGTNDSFAGTGKDYDFELRRQGITLSGDKWITPDLQFELTFKNEEKDGERRFGKGYACAAGLTCATTQNATNTAWATLMIAEPINRTTRQVDAKLNWSGDKFLLSAGYYGSFYMNHIDNISPILATNSLLNANRSGLATLNPASPLVGGVSLRDVLQQAMAVPPDNHAHQLYLDGFYAFTPTTRGTAKISYTHAVQDDTFNGDGFVGPAGRNSLDAEVNTTLVQLGLTSNPLPKLSLLANARYENKKDKTPLDLYNLEALTPAATTVFSLANPGGRLWTNSLTSSRKWNGKLEASYLLPADIRATAGVDYEEIKRQMTDSSFVAGMSALRPENDETGVRFELRRSLGETINAAASFRHSNRIGSDWYNVTTSAAVLAAGYRYGSPIGGSSLVTLTTTANPSTVILPVMYENRDRNTWKLSADWTPTERLDMQFVFEKSSDQYTSKGLKGVESGDSRVYSVDASFAISDKWKLKGYAERAEQDREGAHSTDYIAKMNNINYSFNLGLAGTPTPRLQVGADLTYSYDNSGYDLSLPTLPVPSAENLAIIRQGFPDVTFKQFTMSLFGQYAVQKNADIRLDIVHQRNKLKEWSWNYNGTPFTYSDNTTVGVDPDQKVTFIGASYIYRF